MSSIGRMVTSLKVAGAKLPWHLSRDPPQQLAQRLARDHLAGLRIYAAPRHVAQARLDSHVAPAQRCERKRKRLAR